MEPNEIHQTIAEQVAHCLPADLTPGKTVTMAALREDTLLVKVMPADPEDARSRDVQIRYDRGRDHYDVTVYRLGEKSEYPGAYCDQLGELCFGEHAAPFTMPMVQISNDDGETWTVIG